MEIKDKGNKNMGMFLGVFFHRNNREMEKYTGWPGNSSFYSNGLHLHNGEFRVAFNYHSLFNNIRLKNIDTISMVIDYVKLWEKGDAVIYFVTGSGNSIVKKEACVVSKNEGAFCLVPFVTFFSENQSFRIIEEF